jgi:hypothetical protein
MMMKIPLVRELDPATAGFSVEAKLLNCHPPKDYDGQYGPFKKQTIQLIDPGTEDKIFCRLSGGFVHKEDIGKDITVTSCRLRTYQDELQLETTKESSVGIDRAAQASTATQRTATAASKVERATETIQPPRTFEEMLVASLDDVNTILESPGFRLLLQKGEEITLANEDVRSLLISRLIHHERNKW